MSHFNRRRFLVVGSQLIATLPFLGMANWASDAEASTTYSGDVLKRLDGVGYLLSPTNTGHWGAGYVESEYPEYVPDKWGMSAYNIASRERFLIKTPCVGHSVLSHPHDRNKILFISQKPGNQCVEIDLQQRMVTKTFNSAKGAFFIGHAAFSQDGKWVYLTESKYGSTGSITKRNAETYKIEKVFPSGGLEPHELRLIDDDRTIIVSNGGVKSKPMSMMPEDPGNVHGTISFLDSATGKIKRNVVGFEESMSPRHLAFGSEDETFIGLRRFIKKEKEQVALAVCKGGKVFTFAAPDDETAGMKSWLQSLAYCKASGYVAATAPDGDRVTIWSAKTRQFVKSFSLHAPDGLTITADERFFIATSHKSKTMVIDAQTLELAEVAHIPGFNWRHCRFV